jgi:hypothetical protein
VRGDETRIVAVFEEWLTSQGWSVRREVDFVDLVAERCDHRLYVEAKGRTQAIGLDVDTMFGQILRRMPIAEDDKARFAVVVPSEARRAVIRVPPRVRELLRVDVYVVDEAGAVDGPLND